LLTVNQCVTCIELCQELTSFYISITLVRVDERSTNLVILAGEEIVIEIQPNGIWEFSE
jgi:hypothetical protein